MYYKVVRREGALRVTVVGRGGLGPGIGLRLEEVFMFDSKCENRDRARVTVRGRG